MANYLYYLTLLVVQACAMSRVSELCGSGRPEFGHVHINLQAESVAAKQYVPSLVAVRTT